MDSMDGAMLDGRELRVQLAKYGRPSEPYRRGSRYRERYRYVVWTKKKSAIFVQSN